MSPSGTNGNGLKVNRRPNAEFFHLDFEKKCQHWGCQQ